MSQILTTIELRSHLEHFKQLLTHFDYSCIQNVRFMNLESLVTYMDTIPQNPFTLQYHSLQEALNDLEPYLPFTSAHRAREFLNALSSAYNDEDISKVKDHYSTMLKEDLLYVTNRFTTDWEWENLFQACETIRLRKEESLLILS